MSVEHSPDLIAALVNLRTKLEALPEALRGPFVVKGLKPYLTPTVNLEAGAGHWSDPKTFEGNPVEAGAGDLVAGWALIKRGLYWRPNAQGYTGLKSEAGRYSDEEAQAYDEHDGDGTTKMPWADAPDLASSCSDESARRFYAAQLAAVTAENARLREALERVLNSLTTVRGTEMDAVLGPEYRLHGIHITAARAALSQEAPK